jgi:hypothetical protein
VVLKRKLSSDSDLNDTQVLNSNLDFLNSLLDSPAFGFSNFFLSEYLT